MGLDMYITAKRDIRCPHCGEIVTRKEYEDRINHYESEVAYWRKNRELFAFISDNIAPNGYGAEQYAQDLELSIEDLQKIKEFTQKQDIQDRRDDGIDLAIKMLKEIPDIVIVYSADW